MLLGILGASLVGNMLAGKGMLRAGYGNNVKELVMEIRITRMNLDSMEFILEIIYLRNKGWGICYKILMNIQMLVRIGLLCIVKIMKLFILTALELNLFLRKLENLLRIKT